MVLKRVFFDAPQRGLLLQTLVLFLQTPSHVFMHGIRNLLSIISTMFSTVMEIIEPQVCLNMNRALCISRSPASWKFDQFQGFPSITKITHE